MKIQFKDKEVNVISIHQYPTYEGLLEGLPHDKMNVRILKAMPNEAKGWTGINACYLIEPKQTPIDEKGYPFGIAQHLPYVVTILKLKCHSNNNKECIYSELALVFFQNHLGTPFDQNELDKLKEVDWADHAREVLYDDI